MKYLFILLTFPFLSTSECGKKKNKTSGALQQNVIQDTIPACVRQMIDSALKEEPAVSIRQVDEYFYKGKTVYLVISPCCDNYNMLYDTACKPICAPTGGITGRGDGNCADFSKEARHIKLIWKQPEQKM